MKFIILTKTSKIWTCNVLCVSPLFLIWYNKERNDYLPDRLLNSWSTI